jgi:toluene monooxygenase system ferredoxin subunit
MCGSVADGARAGAGYTAVAAEGDLWDGEMESYRTPDGVEVLVVRVEGTYHAYAGSCPHQSQSLVDGDLDGTTLTCAAHLWEFDVCSGQGVNPRGARLIRHDVRVVDGQVFVSRFPVTEPAPGGNGTRTAGES